MSKNKEFMQEIQCPKCLTNVIRSVEEVYLEEKDKKDSELLEMVAPPIEPPEREDYGKRYFRK
ncbi:MAG: hypothetical protein COB02_01490 [Candidatus Cloacimonadota bacterium]|nr:MAG: hypothetical protein COB02_01490 [Candidatus Cloacimonadota bacterium]